MNKYKYYMQRWVNSQWETAADIEPRFKMIVLEVRGLSDKGEIKNIYTETYAESESLRVYLPKNPVREATDIEIFVGFVGKDRRENYDIFSDWIKGRKIKYWDTVRNRETEMVQQRKISVEKDVLVGDTPYLVVPFKFTNLLGETKIKK